MSRRDLVPSIPHAASVWYRNARVFSKLWRGALLPTFLDPFFYLLALGFGLGTYVARINGIPYEDFIAPGLIASAAMWSAAFETTYNVYFRMNELPPLRQRPLHAGRGAGPGRRRSRLERQPRDRLRDRGADRRRGLRARRTPGGRS